MYKERKLDWMKESQQVHLDNADCLACATWNSFLRRILRPCLALMGKRTEEQHLPWLREVCQHTSACLGPDDHGDASWLCNTSSASYRFIYFSVMLPETIPDQKRMPHYLSIFFFLLLYSLASALFMDINNAFYFHGITPESQVM